MGQVVKYVGNTKTIIVLEPDASEGPYVPLSLVTDIGLALITALTTAAGRAAIQAAANGANSDITALLGMLPVDSVTEVITPEGTANMAVLAAALTGYFPVSTVINASADVTVDGAVGVVWGTSAGGAFSITAPRTLGTPNAKVFFVIKTNAEPNPIAIQDDTLALKFSLVNANAFAIVSVNANTVVAGGSQ